MNNSQPPNQDSKENSPSKDKSEEKPLCCSQQDDAENSNEESHSATGDKHDDEIVTLGEFFKQVDHEDKLQKQLMTNKLLQQCTYEKGYIFQQVYSCKTCYEEQLKINHPEIDLDNSDISLVELSKKVPAHGFCLACMINCHEGHDVIELYSKSAFRCDCGNSRMPYSCCFSQQQEQKQLTKSNSVINHENDTPTVQLLKHSTETTLSSCNVNPSKTDFVEKDYENELNEYNDTFFDIYCHCKKLQTDHVPGHKFMLQCQNCEDWFHNNHLLPPILCNSSKIDDYVLVCRNCSPGVNLLAQRDQMWPDVRDLIEKQVLESQESFSCKRQKTDQPGCKLEKIQQTSSDSKVVPPLDILIKSEALESLCQCSESCVKMFSKILKVTSAIEQLDEDARQLERNLEGELHQPVQQPQQLDQSSTVNNNKPEQPQQNSVGAGVSGEMDIDKLMSQALRGMAVPQQAYVAHVYGTFKRDLGEFLQNYGGGAGTAGGESKIINVEAVKQFMSQAEQKRKETLVDFINNSSSDKQM